MRRFKTRLLAAAVLIGGLTACGGAPRRDTADMGKGADDSATADRAGRVDSAGSATGAAAQRPTEAVHAWWTAVRTRDTLAEARLLANDFIFVDDEGSAHGKAETLAMTVDPAMAYQEITPDSIVEHVYGDAAVVNERLHTRVRAGGKPLDVRARVTTTLVRGNTGWQIVASQATALAPPGHQGHTSPAK